MKWILEHPEEGASPLQYIVYYAATPIRFVVQAILLVWILIAAWLWGKAEEEEK